MGKLVKLVGSGIGMASEAIHDYRSRSRSRAEASHSPNPDSAEASSRTSNATEKVDLADDHDNTSSDDDADADAVAGADDEAAWELDDMAEHVAPPSYDESQAGAVEDSEEVKVKKEELMVREMVRMAGPAPKPVGRIPCPVIIPQRRPRNKDRGFVHAYAPVMEQCGVGQAVFSKFLKDWLQASKSDPWIDIVFIAAGVVGMVPEVAAQVVGTVVQVIAGTAKELQSRQRRNTFLDRVNQELFMPRGLYAMVMAFKDEVPGQQPRGPLSRLAGSLGKQLFTAERLDINQTAAKYSNPDPEMSKMKKGLKDIRLVSGRTRGEVELPEAAALVYPELDRAADQDLQQQGNGKGPESEGFKEKWKGAGDWVQDYLDRRAQAAYEGEQYHPTSLTVPSEARPGFSSRYSDPNHAANSGSLISLLTGGAVNPAARRQERRAAKHERREMRRDYMDARRVSRGRTPRGPRRARLPRSQRPGIIKKIMQQDVMYLIVVNLPTEEEMQKSVADLESIMATQEPVEDIETLFEATRSNDCSSLDAALDVIAKREDTTKEGVLARAQNDDGVTVLHIADQYGRVAILELHFHHDIFTNQPGLRQTLLNARTVTRDGPIHMAAHFGQTGFIERLVHYGVDIDIAGPFNFTALHIPAQKNDAALVRDLLRKGAAVDKQSMSNETALHVAAHNNDVETARAILDAGASATVRNAGDLMPGVVARGVKDSEVYKLFVQRDLPC